MKGQSASAAVNSASAGGRIYWCAISSDRIGDLNDWKMPRDESASESAFSDAEDRPPTQRKRQRSVNEMVKSLEGKKKRITSPKQQDPVSSELRTELKSLIAESVEIAVYGLLWQKI